MRLRLIRNATLQLEVGGRRLLVDPSLGPAGCRPPVAGTPNPRPNPTVELPEAAEAVVAWAEAVLVTHLHQDHFDETGARLVAPYFDTVLASVRDDEVGAASGTLNAVQQFAGAAGVAVLGTVFFSAVSDGGFADALTRVLWIEGALLVAGALLVFLLPMRAREDSLGH